MNLDQAEALADTSPQLIYPALKDVPMRSLSLSGASALALTLAPGAALSLTAEAAWQSWVDAADEAGIALTTGSETRSGDTLSLAGVAFAFSGEDGTTISGSMGDVTFTEQGDQTVAVTLPDSYPITVSGTDSDGASGSALLNVRQPGGMLVMSDTDDGGVATEYDFPTVEIVLTEATTDGEAEDLDASMTMTELSGINSRGAGETPQIEGRFAAATVAFLLSGTDRESGGQFEMEITAADVQSASTGTLSSIFTVGEDMEAAIEDGFSTDGSASTGPITFSLSGDGEGETFAAEGGIAGTEVALAIDADRLDYEMGYEGVSFTASGSEIPLPEVTGMLGALSTVVSLPAAPSEEAQPMSLSFALRDLSLGDEIWALFDPTGALPRDPATAAIALAGQVRMLQSLFSEEAMEADGPPPAEVDQLQIDELTLSVAGAELTGTGAVTLDYDAPGPFGPGTPAPDGGMTLRLAGGLGLLDTLVEMGLLPNEQAMGFRMMAGMLARPGPDGGDVLTSEIVVQPDGTVLANGAPLPF